MTGMRVGLRVMVGWVWRGSGGFRKRSGGDSSGGNCEKTWLWDIKGTPCGRNDSSSPTRTWQADRRTQITQKQNSKQTTKAHRVREAGEGVCTAKYG